MTIGHPDSKLSYPGRQAWYPVSVRHNTSLLWASFGFHLAVDTLAFSYKIPVITVLSGLETIASHPLGVLHARHTSRSSPFGLGFTKSWDGVPSFDLSGLWPEWI